MKVQLFGANVPFCMQEAFGPVMPSFDGYRPPERLLRWVADNGGWVLTNDDRVMISGRIGLPPNE